MEKFYSNIQEIFDRIKQPVPEFTYDEKTREYIAVDGYNLNGYDYTVVVKDNGHVVFGLVEGNTFFEENTLGYIEV